jgi:hypothetical protein
VLDNRKIVAKFLPRATIYFDLWFSNPQNNGCFSGRGFVGIPGYRGKEDVARNVSRLAPATELKCGSK